MISKRIIEKRRIYDITNVLEGIGLIEKKLKNRIHWNIALGFYILLRAVNRFAANYNSFPRQFNGEMDEDISRLKTTDVSLLSDLGCNGSNLTEGLINEMFRYGAAELQDVATFIGKIASQEVIKLDIVLHQHWVLDCHPWLVLEQKLLLSMASARAKVTGVFWENLGFFAHA